MSSAEPRRSRRAGRAARRAGAGSRGARAAGRRGERDRHDDRHQDREQQRDELAEQQAEQQQTRREQHRAVGDVRTDDVLCRSSSPTYGTPPERRTGAAGRPSELRVRCPLRLRCGARGRPHPGPSPRRGPAPRRASPSPRPCAPRGVPAARREPSPVMSPAAFFARPVILSMMLMCALRTRSGRPETPIASRRVTQRGGAPPGAREGRFAAGCTRSCGASWRRSFRLCFRMHVSGAEHIPAEGAAIVAPNHKSFWDSFFIAVCTRRHCASWRRRS